MSRFRLFPYPHVKKKPQPIVPASREDITKLISRLELVAKIKMLSVRERHRLLKLWRKEGKI